MAASDASDVGAGLVIFQNPPESRPIEWNKDEKKMHIFLKELLSAVLCVEWFLQLFPRVRRILLACDNTAVCHALNRGFSSNKVANELLRRLYNALSKRDVFLDVVPVKGTDNAADPPSRGLALDTDLNTRTLGALKDFQDGKRHVIGAFHGVVHGIRHDEDTEDAEDEASYAFDSEEKMGSIEDPE